MAIRHLGIITTRVVKWHKFLPPSVRSHYDVDDMISDVVMHVLAQSPKHNAVRGKESTFVWWTADNKCKCILKFYQKQIRAGAPVQVEDEYGNVFMRGSCMTVELSDVMSRTLPCVDQGPEFVRALNAVERVIEYSSDAVCDLLEKLLTGTLTRREIDTDLISELRIVVTQHGATMDDFLRVLSVSIA